MQSRLALFALVAVAACLAPTEGCTCTPTTSVGIVAGVVTRASGAPVGGAEVRVEARARGCADSTGNVLASAPLIYADGAGVYRTQLRTIISSDTMCIRLVARDRYGGTTDSVVADGIRMRLAPASTGNRRPDSVRVDLRLP